MYVTRRLVITAGICAGLASSAWLAAGHAAPKAPAAALETQQATKFTVDPVHSAAIFGIQWMEMTPFYGQFTDFSGTVSYDGSNPATFSCDVSVPVESVDSHNEGRDRHLKSPDFFNAREFPNITFKSTGLTDNGDGTWTLKGNLAMHGQEKPVEAKVTHLLLKQGPQGGTRCGFSTELNIKRSEWGVGPQQGLGDDVKLMISIQSAAE
jgi:polyisoprenoid-binding protein YceI